MKKIKKMLVFAVFSLLLLPYFSGNIQAQNRGMEVPCEDEFGQYVSYTGYCAEDECVCDVCMIQYSDCITKTCPYASTHLDGAEACGCQTCLTQYSCDYYSCPNPNCSSNANCYCSTCHTYYNCTYAHNCPNNNNNNNNSSGGGGGGGGGSGTTNPNGGGNGTNTGTSHQKTSTNISNAAQNAVAAVVSTDPIGKKPAKCNIGVANAFKALFGNNATDLDNKNANAIVQYWRNSNDWESITKNEAQNLANSGWFVVAGWENTDGGSGHVCVIVPGTEIGGWPSCMDTGSGMRTTSQGLNYSFGKDKRNNVEYYQYK